VDRLASKVEQLNKALHDKEAEIKRQEQTIQKKE